MLRLIIVSCCIVLALVWPNTAQQLAVPNLTLTPVCRVEGRIVNATNLPPLPNLTDTGFVTIPVIAAPWYLNVMAPYSISSGIYPDITYSTAPLGVLWSVRNEETDTAAPGVLFRWSFGEFTPPDSPANGSYSVPYDTVASTTRIVIEPQKVNWFFSRSLGPHKFVTNGNLLCVSTSNCSVTIPVDPPLDQYTSFSFVEKIADPIVLPVCLCYVNAPCSKNVFLYETNSTTDISALPHPPPPPPPPGPPLAINASCIPTPEVCNGLDDNCNNIIDDVPGVGLVCGAFTLGNCQQGTLQCFNGSLQCIGQILPSAELCIDGDFNCDGFNKNIPGLYLPCGSDVGECRKGVRLCDPLTQLEVCQGEVAPSIEVCDGLDNDCNALTDDGCVSAPAPETPAPPPMAPVPALAPVPSPTDSEEPTPTPSPSTTPPPSPPPPPPPPSSSIPSLTSPLDIIAWLLSLAGVSFSYSGFNPLALILLLGIVLVLIIVCCIRSQRESAMVLERPYNKVNDLSLSESEDDDINGLSQGEEEEEEEEEESSASQSSDDSQ